GERREAKPRQGDSVSSRHQQWTNTAPAGRGFGCVWGLMCFLLLPTPTQAAEHQSVRAQVPSSERGQPVGRLSASRNLEFVMALPLRNREGLTNFLELLYDPNSPQYPQYLTPEEFTQRFGPSERDYQTLIAFAESHGLKVSGTHPNRTLLDLSGTVVEIEETLH